MNKVKVRLAIAALFWLAPSSPASARRAADPIRIGIANFGEHPQLNASIDGFKKALADNGYRRGQGRRLHRKPHQFRRLAGAADDRQASGRTAEADLHRHHAGFADRQEGAGRLGHSDRLHRRHRSGRGQPGSVLGRRRRRHHRRDRPAGHGRGDGIHARSCCPTPSASACPTIRARPTTSPCSTRSRKQHPRPASRSWKSASTTSTTSSSASPRSPARPT